MESDAWEEEEEEEEAGKSRKRGLLKTESTSESSNGSHDAQGEWNCYPFSWTKKRISQDVYRVLWWCYRWLNATEIYYFIIIYYMYYIIYYYYYYIVTSLR